MKEVIPETLLGVYINPDDLEKSWRQSGHIDFSDFKVRVDAEDALGFFSQSVFLAHAGFSSVVSQLSFDAIRLSDRAYIFDNSTQSGNASQSRTWLAEITNGTELEFKTDLVPHWFETYVLDKLS